MNTKRRHRPHTRAVERVFDTAEGAMQWMLTQRDVLGRFTFDAGEEGWKHTIVFQDDGSLLQIREHMEDGQREERQFATNDELLTYFRNTFKDFTFPPHLRDVHDSPDIGR